jgi:hypothetical protein
MSDTLASPDTRREFPIRTTRIAQLAKLAFAYVACECLWPAHAAGSIQHQVASVDSTIRVAIDRPVEMNSSRLATVEPYLAADRRDPNHFLAGVILVPKMGDPRDPAFKSESICAALTSFDGGRTWIRHDFPAQGCGDPWVALLANHRAMLVGLAGSELVAYRSTDGGKTWNDTPVSFGRGHDHGTIGSDATTGVLGGNVYVVSHQTTRDSAGQDRDVVFVARSSNGGETFDPPTRISPSNLPTFADNPVILSDGALVVPFVNYIRQSAFDRSDLVWTSISTNSGRTFSVPRYVSDCAGDWGQLAVDGSAGPFRDHLYWACWDYFNRHVFVFRSTDRGERWSDPVTVNRGSRPVQTAMIAVNREGVVGVSWYDSREDPRGYRKNFRCQNLLFTASLDGGRTFLPEVKISSAENCPITPANGEAGWMWPTGGEYHGLAADAAGRFQLLWADSRDGIYQLRTATATVTR